MQCNQFIIALISLLCMSFPKVMTADIPCDKYTEKIYKITNDEEFKEYCDFNIQFISAFVLLYEHREAFRNISFNGKDEINQAFDKLSKNEYHVDILYSYYKKIREKMENIGLILKKPSNVREIIISLMQNIIENEISKNANWLNSELIGKFCIVIKLKKISTFICDFYLNLDDVDTKFINGSLKEIVYNFDRKNQDEFDLINVPDVFMTTYNYSKDTKRFVDTEFDFYLRYTFKLILHEKAFEYELNAIVFSINKEIKNGRDICFIKGTNGFICFSYENFTGDHFDYQKPQLPDIFIYKKIK